MCKVLEGIGRQVSRCLGEKAWGSTGGTPAQLGLQACKCQAERLLLLFLHRILFLLARVSHASSPHSPPHNNLKKGGGGSSLFSGR